MKKTWRREWKRRRGSGAAVRVLAVLAMAAVCLAAAGCPKPPLDPGEIERRAREQQRRMRLPRELTRLRHLEPVSGTFPRGDDSARPGFSLSIPPGGWFHNTGLAVPDAAAVFVHGETDPFDIVVAVVPDQPPLRAAADAVAEANSPDVQPVRPTAPAGAAIEALVAEYFARWHGKDFRAAPGAARFVAGAGAPHARIKGYFTPRARAGAGPPPHDTAQVFAFIQNDARTTLLIFTYPEIFEQRLQIYIDDMVAHFALR